MNEDSIPVETTATGMRFITLYGVHYAMSLFEHLGLEPLAPIGSILRIDRREDGVVTITRMYELERATDPPHG